MKRILLIQTGGTIGSTTIDKNINVRDQVIPLSEVYLKGGGRNVVFDLHTPFHILSENLEPRHWQQLINFIQSQALDLYDGILLTHGSDTLPYTAALLAYHFRGISIPLILVCANKPIDTPHSNGMINFSKAVDFICDTPLPGVFVTYQNHDGKISVHLGSRLMASDWYYDDFNSFGDGVVYRSDIGLNLSLAESLKDFPKRKEFTPAPCFKGIDILAHRTHPGLRYANLHCEEPPTAFLHILYHSATANTTEGTPLSLMHFIKKHPTVPHFLLSFKHSDQALYDSSHRLIEAGGIPLQNICPEAALAKLYYCAATEPNHLKERATQCLYFEVLPPHF